jgi:hypothetical protein
MINPGRRSRLAEEGPGENRGSSSGALAFSLGIKGVFWGNAAEDYKRTIPSLISPYSITSSARRAASGHFVVTKLVAKSNMAGCMTGFGARGRLQYAAGVELRVPDNCFGKFAP